LPRVKDAIDLTAELPGAEEKDVDVTLADGMLTIRGEKKTERDEQDKDKNWHVVERSYGSFSRIIPLPFDPDPGKVEAKFDKGVFARPLAKAGRGGEEAAKDRNQESLKSCEILPPIVRFKPRPGADSVGASGSCLMSADGGQRAQLLTH
jgi:Hsp20/alpha crystallin family